MNVFQSDSGDWVVRPDGLNSRSAAQRKSFTNYETAEKYLLDQGYTLVYKAQEGARFTKG